MGFVQALAPVAIAGLVWGALYELNRRTGWFRIGELIFWDVIVLILVTLVWLRWY